MTYALSWPLQEAVYALLNGNVALGALIDGVHDAGPGRSSDDGVWVTLGDETAEDWSTGDCAGARHTITVAVHAPAAGFAEAKKASAAVSDALLDGTLTLARGHVVNIRFVDARTFREEADRVRRIEMRFRITIEDTV
ncbi:MAG: DUF3168 domain-containing protein [Pseudomonadota bacterium]